MAFSSGRGPGYGVVLLLILIAIGVTTASGPEAFFAPLSVAFRGLTLLAVMLTAGSRRVAIVAVSVLLVLALAGTVGSSVAGASTGELIVVLILDALLVAAAPVIIVRDVVARRVVDRATVGGALSIYLLIGLFFASLYGVIGRLGAAPVFASGPGTSADYFYFSMITITTTGYGDLVPGSGIVRTAATLEALIGQLYLVAVVGLVVGRLGTQRPERRDSD